MLCRSRCRGGMSFLVLMVSWWVIRDKQVVSAGRPHHGAYQRPKRSLS